MTVSGCWTQGCPLSPILLCSWKGSQGTSELRKVFSFQIKIPVFSDGVVLLASLECDQNALGWFAAGWGGWDEA